MIQQSQMAERQSSSPSRDTGGPDGLGDVLDRVLDKGLVIAGDITVSIVDTELLTLKVRLLLASADTARAMGIDWWEHDPKLSSAARDRQVESARVQSENEQLLERLERMEARLAALSPPNGEQNSEGSEPASSEESSNVREQG